MDIRNKLFYFPDNPVKEFVKIIEKYLNDNIDYNYKNIHDVLIKNYTNYISGYQNQFNLQSVIDSKNEEISKLNSIIKKYEEELNNKNLIIHYYEKGKLYKLSKKIYQSYYKLKNKE